VASARSSRSRAQMLNLAVVELAPLAAKLNPTTMGSCAGFTGVEMAISETLTSFLPLLSSSLLPFSCFFHGAVASSTSDTDICGATTFVPPWSPNLRGPAGHYVRAYGWPCP
jgi:hypothetical protein